MEQVENIKAYLTLYPDDRLAALLAHAEDGKLSYHSCCCLVGAINANHALKGMITEFPITVGHYAEAKCRSILAGQAESEFSLLGDDQQRRNILIPLIRAEMAEREKACEPVETPQLVEA